MQIEDLRTKLVGKKILLLDEVNSTNDEARRLSDLGYGEGTVVIAASQIRGRGRFDRRWVSPSGGIYLSVILKPYINPSKLPLITFFSSVAVVRTIRGLTKLGAAVKWPNDIVILDKKVGGILCEAARNTIVVGVGINLNASLSLFPRSLKKQVTSIKFELGMEVDRDKIIKILLEEFDKLYRDFLHRRFAEIISEWVSMCETLGNKVSIETNKGIIRGTAEAVGKNGELLLRSTDGKIKKIQSTDVIKLNTEKT